MFRPKSKPIRPHRSPGEFAALEKRALFCFTHWGVDAAAAAAAQETANASEEPAVVMPWTRRFNFQIDGTPSPDFYRVDTGDKYTTRSNGLTYGWNVDNRNGRDRQVLVDQRYDTLHHLQKSGTNFSWDFAVANGQYTVRIVAGDASFFDSVYRVNVEGQLTVSGTPTSANRFVEGVKTVNVADGRLTVSNASGASNNKIAFIEIVKGPNMLSVVSVAASDSTAGESNNNGTFTLTRSGDVSAAMTASYTLGGTAVNGTDYASLGGSVNFAAGSSTATVTVAPINDTTVESSENVTLNLTPMQHYSNGFSSSATVTIADNDSPTNLGTLSWATKKLHPKARSEAFGGVVGDKLFTFGGYVDNTYKPSNQGFVYNRSTDSWTQLGNIPFATSHVATANDSRYIYTAGGYPAPTPGAAQTFATDKAWRYDTTSDSWAVLPNLPAARGSMAMALVGRTLYAFGGSDASRADKPDHWALNLDATSAGWVRKTSMPAPRNHFAAVTIDGRVYSVGGQTKQDSQAITYNDVFRYNPATNAWDSVAPTLSPSRSHANNSTIVHAGRIIILGGVTNANTTTMANVEAYDPATNRWSVLASLPNRAMAGVAGSFGDKIIFTTGFGSGVFRGNTYIGTFA